MKIEDGEIRNLSFDKKRVIPGWCLFISDDNEEYLIRQNNFMLGFKQYRVSRKIYQANISLYKFSISGLEMEKQIKKKSEKSYLGVAIGLPLSNLVRDFIPQNWLWGKSNLPIDMLEGIINLFFFWLALAICLSVVSYWRKNKLIKELEKRGISLKRIGKGYALTPLIITQKKLKWW
ncbi:MULTISPECIES: hypothetical protein [unclassified Enterococcus]|uniref:hypothetical protein n=1 Tax=unclassified Enterococcus TaxID=2608891 RepID=UPI001A9C0AF3|nr:hypothetical protein [Enterococcus sp. DIV1271a]MBO1300406.1 hypothetical protein [Enterococcus sp. DIV1271a]